jgi:DNA-binding response OmpR family regulator
MKEMPVNQIDFRGRKILIVEDEASIGDVCRRVLTKEGFEVDIAANGKIAQGIIGEKQYDLCLIDIRTPAMNGKQLYEWLEEKYPQITRRVIFTTGDVMEGDIQKFLKETGKPFLPKPFSPGELKAIVKQTLQGLKHEEG